MRLAPHAVMLSLLLTMAACDEAPKASGSAKASASAAAPAPSATAPAATATASASLPPRSDCPKDSSGPGTLGQPCLGKGTARMMEAKWTGKTDDKGPSFKVVNKAPKPVLFGKIAVYFYDKAGKQLETKGGDKPAPFKTCSGNSLFGGIMKVDETAVITFSCVTKADVPEGTAAIEGEVISVGFADASEKKSEFFWANPELAPAVRAKSKDK